MLRIGARPQPLNTTHCYDLREEMKRISARRAGGMTIKTSGARSLWDGT
jgi:hypothetical protein